MEEEIFCVDCKQLVPKKFMGSRDGHKFEDGWRCNGCAQARVRKVRGK